MHTNLVSLLWLTFEQAIIFNFCIQLWMFDKYMKWSAIDIIQNLHKNESR